MNASVFNVYENMRQDVVDIGLVLVPFDGMQVLQLLWHGLFFGS